MNSDTQNIHFLQGDVNGLYASLPGALNNKRGMHPTQSHSHKIKSKIHHYRKMNLNLAERDLSTELRLLQLDFGVLMVINLFVVQPRVLSLLTDALRVGEISNESVG